MLPTRTRTRIVLASVVSDRADAVAVLMPEKSDASDVAGGLDEASHRAVERLIDAGVARGTARDIAIDLVESDRRGHRRVLIAGLGSPDKIGTEALRQAAGAVVKAARKQRLPHVAVMVPSLDAVSVTDAAVAIATGALLASFEYDEYHGSVKRKKDGEDAPPRELMLSLIIPEDQAREIAVAVDRAVVVAEAQNFARTIASRPGNDINPPTLAKVAQDLARESKLAVRVMDEREMKRLGMGGILAVGAGSNATPPRMIVLEYRPGRSTGARKQGRGSRAKGGGGAPPLLVVGKAITFDTGGISIKPADRMGRMVFDKCGGMAVLGLMHAIARLKPPIPVIGILASAENHISETAYRPGDILRMYNGVTVEVTNTDAEGRLVLGDALAWGIETYEPAAVINLATLTGGCVVALGHSTAGLMSNNDDLAEEVRRCAESVGERAWRLPLTDEAREMLKSGPADIVNSAGRWASPLQGGAFLNHFVPDGTPWVHLDIAGTAETEKELPYYAPGATGWGVRTLVQWVLQRASVVTESSPSRGNSMDTSGAPPRATGAVGTTQRRRR